MSNHTNQTTLVLANTKAPATRELDLAIVALSDTVVRSPWSAMAVRSPWSAGRMGLRATRAVISVG